MQPIQDLEESPRVQEDYVAKANTLFADLEARINAGWVTTPAQESQSQTKPKKKTRK